MYYNTLVTINGAVFTANVQVIDFPIGEIVACDDSPELIGTRVKPVMEALDEIWDWGWKPA